MGYASLRLPPEGYAKLCGYVLGRDGFRCRNCNFRGNLHAHHIVFRSHGGEDIAENLVTLCSGCHDGVHNDVQDGEPGLTIALPANAEQFLVFKRGAGWRPR